MNAPTDVAVLEELVCTAAGYTVEQVKAMLAWQQAWLASGYETQWKQADGKTQVWVVDLRQQKCVAGIEFGGLESRLEGDSYVMAMSYRRLL